MIFLNLYYGFLINKSFRKSVVEMLASIDI